MEEKEEYTQPLPPIGKSKGVIEYQLGTQDKISSIINSLQGGFYDRDEKGQIKFVKTGKVKINSEGIQSILLLIDSTIGKDISLSQASDNQLKALMRDAKAIIIRAIANPKLQKIYEIDLNSKDFILESLTNLMEFNINRAKNGFTSRLINTNINVTESTSKEKFEPVKKQGFNLFGGGMNQ